MSARRLRGLGLYIRGQIVGSIEDAKLDLPFWNVTSILRLSLWLSHLNAWDALRNAIARRKRGALVERSSHRCHCRVQDVQALTSRGSPRYASETLLVVGLFYLRCVRIGHGDQVSCGVPGSRMRWREANDRRSQYTRGPFLKHGTRQGSLIIAMIDTDCCSLPPGGRGWRACHVGPASVCSRDPARWDVWACHKPSRGGLFSNAARRDFAASDNQ